MLINSKAHTESLESVVVPSEHDQPIVASIDEQLLKEVEDMELGEGEEVIRNNLEEVVSEENTSDSSFICTDCDEKFQNNTTLTAHRKEHDISCTKCIKVFKSSYDLQKHNTEVHVQWNCNDCPHQAHCASELRKHLKETGHMPVIDKKKLFDDYRECYTCKMDFDGYSRLMEHRKEIHPSNKKCKNFDSGNCIYGDKCWYVHSAESEETQTIFKCNLCVETFKSRTEFMVHKKKLHAKFVPNCEKFSIGKCMKGNDCWFIHADATNSSSRSLSSNESSTSVFQKDVGKALPPDSVEKMVELMEMLNLTMKTLAQTLKK